MRNIEHRLKRLEQRKGEQFTDVLVLIKKGKYYDELTEAQQERYAQYYYGFSRQSLNEFINVFRDKQTTEAEAMHFLLEKKPKPPTPEEMEQRRIEIEEYMRMPIEEN